ncbi:MAG TPA: hypothetical protein VLF67_00935 [Candidatus Saccharimonas sp.]|nr:hypothetical protein [Candidatus Saccharimonas sp.]
MSPLEAVVFVRVGCVFLYGGAWLMSWITNPTMYGTYSEPGNTLFNGIIGGPVLAGMGLTVIVFAFARQPVAASLSLAVTAIVSPFVVRHMIRSRRKLKAKARAT